MYRDLKLELLSSRQKEQDKKGEIKMWVSKKKWNDLEKRVADLEQKQNRLLIEPRKVSEAISGTIINHPLINRDLQSYHK